jgi:hypothetical protein
MSCDEDGPSSGTYSKSMQDVLVLSSSIIIEL